jgi:hypothetical protein
MTLVLFAIPILVGVGISWWVLGSAITSWLQTLCRRLIPFAFLSVLGGLWLSRITFKWYPFFRNNGPDKALVLESLKGDGLIIVLFLTLNQVTAGWPGKITFFMGVMIALCTVACGGLSINFLATLAAEVLYRLGFYSRRQ